jgi:hypothetical protein
MRISFKNPVSIQRKANFACVTGALISASFFAIVILGFLLSCDEFKSYVYFSSLGVVESIITIEIFALLFFPINLSKRYRDYSFLIGWLWGIMFSSFIIYIFGVLVEGFGKSIGLWVGHEPLFYLIAFVPCSLLFCYSYKEMKEHNKIYTL